MHINNMISKKMLIKKILLNTKRNLFNVLSSFNKQKGELLKHDVKTINTITDTKKGPLLSTTAKEEIKTRKTEDKKDQAAETKEPKQEKEEDKK